MAHIYLRGNIYWVTYYKDGKRHRESFKTKDKKYAKYLYSLKEQELTENTPLLNNTASIADIFKLYMDHSKNYKTSKTYQSDKQRLKDFLDSLKITKLTQLQTSHIQKYISDIVKKGRTKSTANRYIEIIKTFLNYAVRNNYIKINPARDIKKFKIEQRQGKFLKEEEIIKLLSYAKKNKSHLYSIISAAIYAGLRLGELINLEWSDIDFKKSTITIQPKGDFIPKSKRIRVIPLATKLKAVLEPLRAKAGYCFLTPDGNQYSDKKYRWSPLKALKRLSYKAGLRNVNWYVLRRTFGSQLAMKNISLLKIQIWMGHANPQTTYRHYAHLVPSYDKDINKI